MKPITLEDNEFVTCEITSDENQTQFTGKLSYRGFVNGALTGETVDAIQNQYHSICSLISNEGGMLRCGTIMLGYHNKKFKGDVLLPDGEVIGRWDSDELEWCFFYPEGQSESVTGAPSPWMLQDAIADWLAQKSDDSESSSGD